MSRSQRMKNAAKKRQQHQEAEKMKKEIGNSSEEQQDYQQIARETLGYMRAGGQISFYAPKDAGK
jgi:ABC-type enterochelin transport system substrate-binding protein